MVYKQYSHWKMRPMMDSLECYQIKHLYIPMANKKSMISLSLLVI